MSGQIVEFAPATRVASRKLGPVAGTSRAVAERARRLRDEDVREDVRQVRDARHHAVVQSAASIAAGWAPIADERAVQALVERARRCRPGRQVPGRAVEEVGAGVLDARGLGARERVAADEARVVAAGDDRALGRADVADRAVAGAARAPRRRRRRARRRAPRRTRAPRRRPPRRRSPPSLDRAARERRGGDRRSGSKPTTRASRRSRAASPIEPPISPTPTTATFTRALKALPATRRPARPPPRTRRTRRRAAPAARRRSPPPGSGAPRR